MTQEELRTELKLLITKSANTAKLAASLRQHAELCPYIGPVNRRAVMATCAHLIHTMATAINSLQVDLINITPPPTSPQPDATNPTTP